MFRFFVFWFCVLVFATHCPRASANVLGDDFNDNSQNQVLWTQFADGIGATVNETNGRLEVTISPNSSGLDIAAGYLSNFYLRGDFDIQVDYSLLQWTNIGEGKLGLCATTAGVVERLYSLYYPNVDTYITDGGMSGYVVTNDTSGTLRVVRTGNLTSAYYYNSGSWCLVGSGTGAGDDTRVRLSAWTHDFCYSHSAPIKIAFDNFTINSGTIGGTVPEPSSIVGLVCALAVTAGLACSRISRRDLRLLKE